MLVIRVVVFVFTIMVVLVVVIVVVKVQVAGERHNDDEVIDSLLMPNPHSFVLNILCPFHVMVSFYEIFM